MKKYAICLLLLCLSLLAGCDNQTNLCGPVTQWNGPGEDGVTSFVVRTGPEEQVGVLMTGETWLFPDSDGVVTEEAFRTGARTDVIVSVTSTGRPSTLTTQTGETIKAYSADVVDLCGYRTQKTAPLSDGTEAEIWRDSRDTLYQLSNGVQLLRVQDTAGPDNGYAGLDFDVFSEAAREKVLAYYRAQRPLYDAQAELERAYGEYLRCEKPASFQAYFISQETCLIASSERILYFETSVSLPISQGLGHTFSLGAAFDRETGDLVSNLDLFACPGEEVPERLLDPAMGYGPDLMAEMRAAFRPEYITLHPDSLTISFPRGTLPSEENPWYLSVDYSGVLREILHDWAIPTPAEG